MKLNHIFWFKKKKKISPKTISNTPPQTGGKGEKGKKKEKGEKKVGGLKKAQKLRTAPVV